MKSFLLLSFLLTAAGALHAQKVDSIFFHLYTDSLKKGTYNYINVDGKCNNNRWLPLTEREVKFSASAGRFDGNSLFVDPTFTGEKITITARLKADSTLFKETVIFIKKLPDNEILQTPEEVMQPARRKRKQ